jgi:putative transposase
LQVPQSLLLRDAGRFPEPGEGSIPAMFSPRSTTGVVVDRLAFLEGIGAELEREVVGVASASKVPSQLTLLAFAGVEPECLPCLHTHGIYLVSNMSTGFRRGGSSVSRLVVHLVFVVKYRRPVISDRIWESLCVGFAVASERLDLQMLELNHERDHVHVLVEYPCKVSVSEIANALKGTSSMVARRECWSEIRQLIYGPAFWTPSYFAASAGGAPIEVLKQYVRSQQTKAALKGGVSTQDNI